ncbi:aminotransferase class I/II-fold pyridoxal phosphate-dependent enzyme [Geomicrobium sp. JSM 1781026]|uniref:aminotransferase class I/II-fold pyridoxal phosphate-dependent enzyme n=1 Tax=Geomicrobium sp. JSM 1781026 TaxID=3344580 RepID=UPI0035C0FD76
MTGVQKYIDRGMEKLQSEMARKQMMKTKRFDTIAAHGLYGMEDAMANQGSIMEPLTVSPAQHFENSDHLEAALSYQTPAWGYTRIHNPTLHYLEGTLALLEGYGSDVETSAVMTSSGMSAIFMATNPFLQAETDGMNFVADAKCYGGTFMLFDERYQNERGIDVRWVQDTANIDAWATRIDDETRFLYVEMPSNPSLTVADLEPLANLAHDHGIPLIVDSTLTTPALMRPICHGADIVVHSISKAIGGSGSAIAGAIVAKHHIPSRVGTDEMRENFTGYVKLWPMRDHGTSLSPLSAHFILNDLRTLRTRVDVMSKSAMRVAQFLEAHDRVEAVHYPGLRSNAGHATASKYMWLADGDESGSAVNRYGHLMSFMVKGGAEAARNTLDRLQIIWRATDLGRHKSVAVIPAISTHQQQGEEGRELAGIPANLIRLSIGVEHPADLMDELDQALR